MIEMALDESVIDFLRDRFDSHGISFEDVEREIREGTASGRVHYELGCHLSELYAASQAYNDR